jgi:Domain of unknown function (DUF4112)
MNHGYSGPWPDGGGAWSRRAAFDRVDRLSRLLDIAFAIPGTRIRFGVEALLRTIPGIGDIAASALSCWILYEAWRLGVPRPLLVRMITNVLVEGIVGAVPVAGDLFDVAWRANRRNVRLLREHFEREGLL